MAKLSFGAPPSLISSRNFGPLPVPQVALRPLIPSSDSSIRTAPRSNTFSYIPAVPPHRERNSVKNFHQSHVPSPPLPHEVVRKLKQGFRKRKETTHHRKTATHTPKQAKPVHHLSRFVHSQRAKQPLTRGNTVPEVVSRFRT